MPKRGKKMSYPERLAIGEQAASGKTDKYWRMKPDGRSGPIRKWSRIYQQPGKKGLVTRMGRSKKGTLSSFSESLWQEILSVSIVQQMRKFAKTSKIRTFSPE